MQGLPVLRWRSNRSVPASFFLFIPCCYPSGSFSLMGPPRTDSHQPRPAPRRPDLSPFSSGSTSAVVFDSINLDLIKEAVAQKIQPGASL